MLPIKILCLCFLLFLYLNGEVKPQKESCGPKDGTKEISKQGDTLVVIARLTEIKGKFVENELYDYVYVMKYSVITVEKGSYTKKEILVGHYNPLIPRKQIKDKMDPYVDGTVERFTIGEKHRLTLIEPIEKVWDGAIEDEYFDTDLKKYFALKVDVVK
ncbi:MAG: hypothetical protein N2053_03905 [Chitinispirillaceae bacterium]|nr:hypothetical protein [Chitinispirillaceae bacterium]